MPSLSDVFCGSGGFSLGFVQAGYRHLWGIDADPHACASYEANIGKAIRARVESVDWASLERPDVLLGSPPCQGYSSAGKRDKNDERNRLVWGFVWAVAVLRPKAFCMENVPGIGQGKWKGYPEIIRMALETMGYKVTVMKLNTADYGVPQLRRRVFWVGALDFQPQIPSPSHAEPPVWDGLKPWVSVREALGLDHDDPAPPVLAGNDKGTNPARRLAIRRVRSERSWSNSPAVEVSERPAPTLPGEPIFINHDVPGRPMDTSGSLGWVEASGQFRRLTVAECSKLMGYPDGFVLSGPQTAQYQQAGNGVCPQVARAIAEMLRAGLDA